jgi:glycosyltransferase involved in cell wall biosynthesis
VRVAVFTNQFPGPVSTFFARDMRGLIESGLEIDVFPVYPVDAKLWCHVPDILNEKIFSRNRLRHLNLRQALRLPKSQRLKKLGRFFQDSAVITASAAKFGIGPTAKSTYVLAKAWGTVQNFSCQYDHILAYWGSYAATYAYMFHRLTNERIPFSMFLHAGDLYQDQVYLRQKLLYADNIFVVCDFNRQYIYDSYPDIYDQLSNKIHMYHPGLDLSEFPYEPNGLRSRAVLGVGRFDKCKGFDYLVRAIQHLARSGIEVKLELIGEGEEERPLKALVSDLGLEDRIKFRGWLSFNEVKRAMKRARMLVHPSSEVGDAVPTVIKEACALGTPVIGTHVAGIPELLNYGRCGILVPPRNVEAMANAINRLLSDEHACQAYAEAARRHVEETFNVWRNGKKLAGILRSSTRCASGVAS